MMDSVIHTELVNRVTICDCYKLLLCVFWSVSKRNNLLVQPDCWIIFHCLTGTLNQLPTPTQPLYCWVPVCCWTIRKSSRNTIYIQQMRQAFLYSHSLGCCMWVCAEGLWGPLQPWNNWPQVHLWPRNQESVCVNDFLCFSFWMV